MSLLKAKTNPIAKIAKLENVAIWAINLFFLRSF